MWAWLERIFGRAPSDQDQLFIYNGLPYLGTLSNGQRLYSNLTIATITEEGITFTNGSFVGPNDMSVHNGRVELVGRDGSSVSINNSTVQNSRFDIR